MEAKLLIYKTINVFINLFLKHCYLISNTNFKTENGPYTVKVIIYCFKI